MIDFINMLFIFGAAILALGNVRKIYQDKSTKGLTLSSQVFFLIWTFWSLYYYAFIDQPISLIGELMLSLAMILYVGLMIKYRKN